jgi:integrase
MLTDVVVKGARPKSARYELRDASRPGLRLVVQPSGVKTFVYRYTFGMRYKKLTLGPPYPTTTLKAAIAAHRDAADALAAGKDPATARRKGTAADDTVTAHAKLYEDLHVATLSEGTADYVKVELDRISDALGNRAIASVTQKDVQTIIDQAMARGPAARNTTWKVARAFFAWVTSRSDIPESPVAKIARPSKDRIRKRALDDAEIKIAWQAADAAGGPPGALVKLLLLSGCRRDEICYLPRTDIKADKIVFPGSRTKTGEPHTVPITPMIRHVLESLSKSGKFALTGADKGLGGHSQARDAVETTSIEHWTYHDLRRTFASGLARLGVPIQVTELCLNHKSGVGSDPLVQIYQQHDYAKEVVAAFEKWSSHVASLVIEERQAAA